MQDVFAHGFEAGAHTLEGFLVTAHEDGQAGLARSDIPARDRGIQAGAAPSGGSGSDALGQFGAGGGHVTEDTALGQAGQRSLFTQHHFFHITGIAHDGENDVGVPGHFSGRFRPAGTAGQQTFRLGFGTAVDGQRIARSQQMPGHGMSHDAGAYPA